MIQPNTDTHPFLRSVADCIDQRVQAEVDAALATLDTAQPIANSLGLSRMPMLWLRYRDEVAQELHRQIERRLCQEVADKLVQPWGQPGGADGIKDTQAKAAHAPALHEGA